MGRQPASTLGASSPSTLDDYVRLVDHGVRPQYLGELKKAGYEKVASDELVRMRRKLASMPPITQNS